MCMSMMCEQRMKWKANVKWQSQRLMELLSILHSRCFCSFSSQYTFALPDPIILPIYFQNIFIKDRSQLLKQWVTQIIFQIMGNKCKQNSFCNMCAGIFNTTPEVNHFHHTCSPGRPAQNLIYSGSIKDMSIYLESNYCWIWMPCGPLTGLLGFCPNPAQPQELQGVAMAIQQWHHDNKNVSMTFWLPCQIM